MIAWVAQLEATVDIKRPLSEVIDFVDNCRNDPIWQTSVLESEKITDGPPRVGSEYHVKEKFLGRVIEQTWRVLERAEDGSYWEAETLSGSFPMKTSMRIEAIDGTTRLTRRLAIEVGHFFKIASPIVVHIAQRELDADFGILKELLESGM